MKFFNFEELWLASHGDSRLMLEIFKDMNTGNDFIVNPKALVDAFWISDRHKAEYLGICALRNYNDYKAKKQVDLPIDQLPPWVPIAVIKENPLVQITDTMIILKEENI